MGEQITAPGAEGIAGADSAGDANRQAQASRPSRRDAADDHGLLHRAPPPQEHGEKLQEELQPPDKEARVRLPSRQKEDIARAENAKRLRQKVLQRYHW